MPTKGPKTISCVRRLGTVLFLAALLDVHVDSALAQINTRDITGLVSDPAGAVIEGAEIEATNAETRQRFNSTTNSLGQYLLTGLPPRAHTVAANMQGFKQALAEEVALHVNDHLRQDFSLQLGEARESVIVQLTPGVVQTESAEIKDAIRSQQVADLPLEGPRISAAYAAQ